MIRRLINNIINWGRRMAKEYYRGLIRKKLLMEIKRYMDKDALYNELERIHGYENRKEYYYDMLVWQDKEVRFLEGGGKICHEYVIRDTIEEFTNRLVGYVDKILEAERRAKEMDEIVAKKIQEVLNLAKEKAMRKAKVKEKIRNINFRYDPSRQLMIILGKLYIADPEYRKDYPVDVDEVSELLLHRIERFLEDDFPIEGDEYLLPFYMNPERLRRHGLAEGSELLSSSQQQHQEGTESADNTAQQQQDNTSSE